MKKTRKGKKREKEGVGVAETRCHNALSDMVKFLKALFFLFFFFFFCEVDCKGHILEQL